MRKKFNLVNIILTSILLILYVINTFSFNMYYPFSHLDLFNPFYIINEIFKISLYFSLIFGIFLNVKYFRDIIKYMSSIVGVISLSFYNTFKNITLDNYKIINSNNLDSTTLEIYRNINSFLPSTFINISFILINVLLIIIPIFIFLEDKLSINDIKSFIFLPLSIFFSIPLNIFDTFIRSINESTYNFLYFKNYGIWHLIIFILLIFLTLLIYILLKRFSKSIQDLTLRILAISLFIHFLSKNSMLIGDGYNVYNNVIASIPLFICDIGKFFVLFAVFFKKKIFYDISFFVHSAGSLTVFFYLGKEGTHNYGTILNYSFLYFAITHLFLFLLTVLPIMLKHSTFKIKDSIIPSLYYGVVIIVASITSTLISDISSWWVDSSNQGLNELYLPNFAFTQICPLPINFPTYLNFPIGVVEINPIYLLSLFLAYVGLFIVFFILQLIIKLIYKSIYDRFFKNKESIIYY